MTGRFALVRAGSFVKHIKPNRTTAITQRPFSAQCRLRAASRVTAMDGSIGLELPRFLLNNYIEEQRQLHEENKKLAVTNAELQRDIKHIQDEMIRVKENCNGRCYPDAENKRLAAQNTELQKDIKRIKEENTRTKEEKIICSGLEQIGYRGTIGGKTSNSTQDRLDMLAKTAVFRDIYNQEVTSRKLDPSSAEECRKNLYEVFSKDRHCGGGVVIKVRAGFFTQNAVAAVVSYLKMQDAWDNPLDWEEVDEQK